MNAYEDSHGDVKSRHGPRFVVCQGNEGSFVLAFSSVLNADLRSELGLEGDVDPTSSAGSEHVDGVEMWLPAKDVVAAFGERPLKVISLSQMSLFLRQAPQTGVCSSHFFFRLRQVRQPVFDLSSLL